MHIRELGRQARVSYMTLWNLYHEKTTRIDFNTIEQLCRTLSVQVGELLEYVTGGEKPKKKPGGLKAKERAK
jgi:putative transcriptional regulator